MATIDEIREKVLGIILPKGCKVDVIIKEDPNGINDSSLNSHIIFKEDNALSINLLIDIIAMQLRDYNLDDIDKELIESMIKNINENHLNYADEEEISCSSINFNVKKTDGFTDEDIEDIKDKFQTILLDYGFFDYDSGYDTNLDQKDFSYYDLKEL